MKIWQILEIFWGFAPDPTRISPLGPRQATAFPPQPPEGMPSEPLPLDHPNKNPGAANEIHFYNYHKIFSQILFNSPASGGSAL